MFFVYVTQGSEKKGEAFGASTGCERVLTEVGKKSEKHHNRNR